MTYLSNFRVAGQLTFIRQSAGFMSQLTEAVSPRSKKLPRKIGESIWARLGTVHYLRAGGQRF